MSKTLIFDGHNDALLRLHHGKKPDPVRAFLDGEESGHLDLVKARQGGLGGGFFAMFVPSPAPGSRPVADFASLPAGEFQTGGLDLATAQRATLAMSAILLRIEREAEGRFRVCRTSAEIRECLASGTLAAIFHIEGAEAIDPELEMLDVLHAAGLRSLGPVWSRSNIFGHGVPFRHPSTPDIGPGLTDIGKALIRRCNALRILIDLSHLNEAGFWDVAEISDAPLVATHSNAHALCASSRNLTDRQLGAIAERRGMVGINFATAFLRPDGATRGDTPIELILDHLEYVMKHVGEDGVGFGSDFDGARIPSEIGSAAGLPKLLEAMTARGYGDALIEKVCSGNWLRVLEETWGK